MNRRDFSLRFARSGLAAAAASGAGLLGAPAGAVAQDTPVEGRQYTRVEPTVPPTPPAPANKIEVIEFFSYACPHCSAFEPTLEAWVTKLPPDVAFHRIPVPFLVNAENLMKTYFALETLGSVAAMQMKVFAAIHVEHNYLDKPADITALMAKNGIDAAKFNAAFNSFSVATSVSRAKKVMAAYKIDSVPTLAVNGRYLTSPAQAGGFPQATAVADRLLQQARGKG